MSKEAEPPTSLYLERGYIYCALEQMTVYTVVGSCVVVCLWDKRLKFGGMTHFPYPATNRTEEATAQYGNVAIPQLIHMMEKSGSKRGDLLAQILGGAAPRPVPVKTLGAENIEIARAILKKKGIQVCSEDVGGTMGRKIVFDTATGHVMTLKVHKVRQSDWVHRRPTLRQPREKRAGE
jgi:chemotaxis protein CheD